MALPDAYATLNVREAMDRIGTQSVSRSLDRKGVSRSLAIGFEPDAADKAARHGSSPRAFDADMGRNSHS